MCRRTFDPSLCNSLRLLLRPAVAVEIDVFVAGLALLGAFLHWRQSSVRIHKVNCFAASAGLLDGRTSEPDTLAKLCNTSRSDSRDTAYAPVCSPNALFRMDFEHSGQRTKPTLLSRGSEPNVFMSLACSHAVGGEVG